MHFIAIVLDLIYIIYSTILKLGILFILYQLNLIIVLYVQICFVNLILLNVFVIKWKGCGKVDDV